MFSFFQDLLICFNSPLGQEGQVDLEDPGRRYQKNIALVNWTFQGLRNVQVEPEREKKN